MRSRRWLLAVMLSVGAVTAACCLGGCYPFLAGFAGGMASAERSGPAVIPFVGEFDRLYPGAVHSISYYTGTAGPPTWYSKVGLHGRYVLYVECPIEFDWTRFRITGYGKPTFWLSEVAEFAPLGDGRVQITYLLHRSYELADWRKLVAAGGDLAALGIEVKKDRPLPGFDRHWESA
jgi:hypothetical protein